MNEECAYLSYFPDIQPFPQYDIQQFLINLIQQGKADNFKYINQLTQDIIKDGQIDQLLKTLDQVFTNILSNQIMNIKNKSQSKDIVQDLVNIWINVREVKKRLLAIFMLPQIEQIIIESFSNTVQNTDELPNKICIQLSEKLIEEKKHFLTNSIQQEYKQDWFHMIFQLKMNQLFQNTYLKMNESFYNTIHFTYQPIQERIRLIYNLHLIEQEQNKLLDSETKILVNQSFKTIILDPFSDIFYLLDELYEINDFDSLGKAFELQDISNNPNQIYKLRGGLFDYTFKQALSILNKNVLDILKLESKLLTIINNSYHNNTKFIESVQYAIQHAFSQNIQDVAVKLNNTFEDIQRQPVKKNISLLKYFENKDYFQEIYKKSMVQRLINIQNYDLERQVLCQMEEEVDEMWFRSCQQIIDEAKESHEITLKYQQYTKKQKSTSVSDVSFHLFGSNEWPFKIHDCLFHPYFQQIQNQFSRFFSEIYENRELKWQYTKSTCLLVGHIEKLEFSIELPAFQASILLSFNQKQVIQVREILATFNGCLQIEFIEKVIKQLIDSKILIKSGDQNKFQSTDQMRVTSQTNHLQQFIKVPELLGETVFEKTREDRIYIIDAQILKILKSQKSCTKQQLIQTVKEHIKIYHHKFAYLAKDDQILRQIYELQRKTFLQINESDEDIIEYLV